MCRNASHLVCYDIQLYDTSRSGSRLLAHNVEHFAHQFLNRNTDIITHTIPETCSLTGWKLTRESSYMPQMRQFSAQGGWFKVELEYFSNTPNVFT